MIEKTLTTEINNFNLFNKEYLNKVLALIFINDTCLVKKVYTETEIKLKGNLFYFSPTVKFDLIDINIIFDKLKLDKQLLEDIKDQMRKEHNLEKVDVDEILKEIFKKK